MKTCFKCHETKPLSEFYAHKAMGDGHLNKCKACTKNDVMLHRDANIDKVRAYDRERGKLPHRIANTVVRTRRWRAEDTRRYAAHSAVAVAKKNGSLIQQPCCVCGNARTEAHHEDYDKPLEVVWYCSIHHKERHKQMKEIVIAHTQPIPF